MVYNLCAMSDLISTGGILIRMNVLSHLRPFCLRDIIVYTFVTVVPNGSIVVYMSTTSPTEGQTNGYHLYIFMYFAYDQFDAASICMSQTGR